MSKRFQNDVNRAFNKVVKIRDQYMVLFSSNPRPWSNDTKIKIESKLQLLKEFHEDLHRFIEKWEDHAQRIKSRDQKDAEFNKLDTWRDDEDHSDMIDEITEILLQGERYLCLENSDASNHSTKSDSSQHSAPANNMPTTAKIPALNIQKFNGDYLKWKSFWQRFELNVHNHPFSKVEKLDALVGLLEGEALDEIAGFEIVEENYDTVVKTLQDRFGNSKIILMELYSNLRAVPPSTSEARSLRKTVNAITNMCRQLQNYGVDINNASLQTEIIQKMPPREKNELTWFQISNENVSTEMILKEMKQIALKAEISTQDLDESNTAEQHRHPDNETTSKFESEYKEYNTHPKAESNSSKKFVCSLCEGDHLSAHCPQFSTVEDKIKQLKLKNCCTKCARRNHDAKQCHSDIRCKNCNGGHYAFICPSRSNENFRQSKTTNAMVSIGVQQGCLLTKQVTVVNPDTQKTADATVYFDSGSQKSYICDQLIRQLKLPRVAKENLHIQGIGAKATNYKSSLVKLKIKTTESYEEISANSIRKIADSVPLMSCNGKFDPASFRVTNHQPDILIGIMNEKEKLLKSTAQKVQSGSAYTELNLTKEGKCYIGSFVQSYSKSINKKSNIDVANFGKLEKKSTFKWRSKSHSHINPFKESDEKVKTKRWEENSSKPTSNSTLSLHIAAYENSIEDKLQQLSVEASCSNLKLVDVVENEDEETFIFPRQMEDIWRAVAETQQFTASQKLFTPIREQISPQLESPSLPSQALDDDSEIARNSPTHCHLPDLAFSPLSESLISDTNLTAEHLLDSSHLTDDSDDSNLYTDDEEFVDAMDSFEDVDAVNIDKNIMPQSVESESYENDAALVGEDDEEFVEEPPKSGDEGNNIYSDDGDNTLSLSSSFHQNHESSAIRHRKKGFTFDTDSDSDEDAMLEKIDENGCDHDSPGDNAALDDTENEDAQSEVADPALGERKEGCEYLQIEVSSVNGSSLGIRCHLLEDKIYIFGIQSGSPAETANLKPMDCILTIDQIVVKEMTTMANLLKENILANGSVMMTVERTIKHEAVKRLEKIFSSFLKTNNPQLEPAKKRMVNICLDESRGRKRVDEHHLDDESFEPATKKKRGCAVEYIEKQICESLAEVKKLAKESGLKYGKTVKQTSYFACNFSECPYKWKAVVNDDLNYQILETKDKHIHGTVERRDGISAEVKEVIIERINGNEAVNPEAILQRCRNLQIRNLPTALQVRNCVAYLKKQCVPFFANISFADLKKMVREFLDDEPDICDVQYIVNESNPQKTDFIIIFSCHSLIKKQREQKHAGVDGTWKLVYNNFVVFVFGFVDLNNHVHVTGVAIASSESTNAFKWLFEFFKHNRFDEGDEEWCPAEVMADNSKAISAALSMVFPDAFRRNCFAHVVRASDTKMQSLRFSDELKAKVKAQIHQLARCAFEEHFDLAAKDYYDEWTASGNEKLAEFAHYFNQQYLIKDKNWYAKKGAGCRTDNGIEGTNSWIKIIFITRRLPLLAAADKMKKFLVKARETNYGVQELHITNADWIRAFDFKESKPRVRYDTDRNCYYVQRSKSTLGEEEFEDFLNSMDRIEWVADDVSIFQNDIAVVAPSYLYDNILTCNCPRGVQRIICKHSLLIECCVLRTKQFPDNIPAMRQTVTETGRNKAGRPRKHAPALTKD